MQLVVILNRWQCVRAKIVKSVLGDLFRRSHQFIQKGYFNPSKVLYPWNDLQWQMELAKRIRLFYPLANVVFVGLETSSWLDLLIDRMEKAE